LFENNLLEKQMENNTKLSQLHGKKWLEKQLEHNMLKVELLWEECHVGQKDNNISPPTTAPSFKTLSSTSSALDVSIVKDKEQIKPTITRGLGMMKSSLLSTQVRTEIINTSCIISGVLIAKLPSLNETRQFIVDQYHD
jgi:hypothetical protein